MTIGHATAVRTTVADAVVDAIDGGSGAGELRFYTSNYATLLCTITLADPAFGAASSGAAALNSVPLEGTCVAGGTVAKFRFLDSDATEILNGDVSTSGSDINLNQTTVVTNDVIRITGITYNAAA
jgi:hypothetical protein